MDAKGVTIRELFEHRDAKGKLRPVQFRVPVFQRTYEWRTETAERLLLDVLDTITDHPTGRPHFIGSMVFLDEPEDARQPDHLMVIDGQQRLLTISLAIGLTEQRLTDKTGSWLHNPGFGPVTRDRIRPAKVDRSDFETLVLGHALTENHRLVKVANQVRHLTQSIQPELLVRALLDNLVVVRVRLDSQDDAETVFESLNFTGQPLTQADLVRTWLLSRFAHVEDQEHIDDTYWRPMERRLQDSVPDRANRRSISPKDTIVDWYLREWLMRNGGRVDSPRVYRRFLEITPPTPDAAEQTMRELAAVSRHYVRLERPEVDDPLYHPLGRLRQIGYNVHWPLLLQLMDRAELGDFPAEDVALVLEGCESLFVRRGIVGWRTNILGRLFEQIAKSRPVMAKDVLDLMLPHWPSDGNFLTQLGEAPLYTSQYSRRIVMLLLQRLDLAYGNKESKQDADATIEHVMPQTIGDSANGRAWKEMLGPEWDRVHKTWLHTLGNLSITRTNPEMSNKPFLGAGGKKDWLSKSLFEMNRRIAQHERWSEAEILARRSFLLTAAAKLWQRPEGREVG